MLPNMHLTRENGDIQILIAGELRQDLAWEMAKLAQ